MWSTSVLNLNEWFDYRTKPRKYVNIDNTKKKETVVHITKVYARQCSKSSKTNHTPNNHMVTNQACARQQQEITTSRTWEDKWLLPELKFRQFVQWQWVNKKQSLSATCKTEKVQPYTSTIYGITCFAVYRFIFFIFSLLRMYHKLIQCIILNHYWD